MMYYSCDVGKFLNSDRGLLDVKNYDYDSLMAVSYTHLDVYKRQPLMLRIANGTMTAHTIGYMR